ncbi:hypothetical protein U1Q18_033194 [Sarracenia purpurea var. burkii]
MGGNSAINPNRVAELNGPFMVGGSQPLSGELERAIVGESDQLQEQIGQNPLIPGDPRPFQNTEYSDPRNPMKWKQNLRHISSPNQGNGSAIPVISDEGDSAAVEENSPQIERFGDLISKCGAPILEEAIQTKSRGKQIMEGINSAGYDGGKSDQITRIRDVSDTDGDTPRYFTAVEEGGGFIPLTRDYRIISYEEGVTEGKRYTELVPIHSGDEPQPDFKANVEQKRGMPEWSQLVEMERTKMGRMARDGMDYTKGTDTEVSHMEIESSQHFTFSSNQDKEACYQSQRAIPTDANIQTSLRRRKAWARKVRPTTETK